MQTEVTLVFPHQLFEKHPAIQAQRPVYLIEDDLYFLQYPFHRKKLMLHRASMKFYENYLGEKNFRVTYAEAKSNLASLDNLFQDLRSQNINAIHYSDTTDYLLARRLKRFGEKYSIKLISYDTPQFINTRNDVSNYFSKANEYFLHNFYMHERKRLQILVDDNKPVGGKWSFDAENRKKIPKGLILPTYFKPTQNKFVVEAEQYVNTNFASNLGTSENFQYAVTFEDAKKWLDDFLQNRFGLFGPYEDAIAVKEPYLFHSVITPYLNTGLLTPTYVVKRIMDTAIDLNIPLASVEGYLRQIIGWREFMRGVYHYKGVYQRKRNFWNHVRKMPSGFYTGETGITPVDVVIKRLHKNAYTHHIERLMVLGNFMQLCEIDPDDIYQWFMEFYIDAYDWVMVPNVYGMSQFADGGIMSTKPYFSGSNYILKMSDFGKGEWSKTWDALYWRFMFVHKDFFQKNIRTSMIMRSLEKMDKKVLVAHLKAAEDFLKTL
jgi:deoxyribodipyrimidine photolyase-related protein